MSAHYISRLSLGDRQAIEALIERLFAESGGYVLCLMVFGSKVRGDDTSESDIDVLVVTSTEDWPLKHRILTLSARLSLEYDVLFNMHVVSQERWTWMKRVHHPLHRGIVTNGLDLTPEPKMT